MDHFSLVKLVFLIMTATNTGYCFTCPTGLNYNNSDHKFILGNAKSHFEMFHLSKLKLNGTFNVFVLNAKQYFVPVDIFYDWKDQTNWCSHSSQESNFLFSDSEQCSASKDMRSSKITATNFIINFKAVSKSHGNVSMKFSMRVFSTDFSSFIIFHGLYIHPDGFNLELEKVIMQHSFYGNNTNIYFELGEKLKYDCEPLSYSEQYEYVTLLMLSSTELPGLILHVHTEKKLNENNDENNLKMSWLTYGIAGFLLVLFCGFVCFKIWGSMFAVLWK